jgi:hypothetical protein
VGVNLNFHVRTLTDPTLSHREAGNYLRSGAQLFSSSPLKVIDEKIHALAEIFCPC